MSCPSWPEIYDSQVLTVIETGNTRSIIMSRLIRSFGDLWTVENYPRLDASLRRLSRKHVISFNRQAGAWVVMK